MFRLPHWLRADKRALLSKDHFSGDGALTQAWASHKSFVCKDERSDDANGGGGGRNAQANWKGKPRSNDTHASTTTPTRGCSGRATTPRPPWASRGTC